MRAGRLTLQVVAVGWILAILALPVGMVFWRAFEHGASPFWHAVTAPDSLHALRLTLEIAVIVVPLNTLFGVLAALLLERRTFPGKALLDVLLDLPFAVSPVVVGLSLVLVYGRFGWWGSWLGAHGVQVIFALPGMVLATTFACLPFVVREVAPLLRELGTEQEQAASTLGATPWQAFRTITLPGIRWGLAYGVVLTTARAIGEFGAVSVVSGRIVGQTETLTVHVQQRYTDYDAVGAYAASVELAALALLTIAAMGALEWKQGRRR